MGYKKLQTNKDGYTRDPLLSFSLFFNKEMILSEGMAALLTSRFLCCQTGRQKGVLALFA